MKKLIALALIVLVLLGCTSPPEQKTQGIVYGEDTKQVTLNYMGATPEDVADLIEFDPLLVIIDVSPYYAGGHLPNAVSYSLADGSFDKAYKNFDKTKTYVVYCHDEAPAVEAATKLVREGFAVVYVLQGNYSAWVQAGYETEN